MNAEQSRKIIVAGAMAVVVGIGATIFAMRPATVMQVAQAVTPPAPLAESPAPADAVEPVPEAPPTVLPAAPSVAARVTPTHKDVVVVKPATARNPDSSGPLAVEPKAASSSEQPVQDVVAAAAAPVPGPIPALASAAGADQLAEASAAPAVSDSEITANVKSEIAVDSPGTSEAIGVVTTNGAVALSGNLASQGDIDHIRIVVARVRDVRSVNTSALSISAL
jgi:hypothetical protein